MLDIFKIITGLLTDKGLLDLFKGKERRLQEFQIALTEKMNDLNKKQIEVNLMEAKHANIFVSGWRPFIGWACGSAFVYHFILNPFIEVFLNLLDYDIALPQMDISQLVAVLFAMLGMGTIRTYEKIKGVAK